MYEEIRAKYLKKDEVAQILGVCNRTLEGMVKANEFPQGIPLGKCLYWDAQMTMEWVDSLFVAQREKAREIQERTRRIHKSRSASLSKLKVYEANKTLFKSSQRDLAS